MPWPKGKTISKEHRNKIAKSMQKFHKENPKIVKVTNEKIRKTMRTAAFRKRRSKLKLQHYRENPETIKKLDRTMTAWWHEHPHVRKEYSEKMKQFFIQNPEKFKKFLQYGKNPSKLNLKTKQGFLVRSKGEKKIADFLHENRIKSSYEQHTLFFPKEGQLCTPDFWLPRYKVFIEYYGGHPKSWKKKVMKNKLYKKHKIPCIFITPAELRNLNYYLLRDAEKISKSKVAKNFKMRKWVK